MIEELENLNGWQRIFVVLSVIWILCVLVLSYDSVFNPYVTDKQITPLMNDEYSIAILDGGKYISGPTPPAAPINGEMAFIEGYSTYSGSGPYDVYYVVGLPYEHVLKLNKAMVVEHAINGANEKIGVAPDEMEGVIEKLKRDYIWSAVSDYTKNIDGGRWVARKKALINTVLLTVLPLGGLYAFFASLGWIWRGFRKQSLK